MKRMLVVAALPLLLIANTVFGEPNLEGYWSVNEVCKGNAPPAPVTGFVIEIYDQSAEGLFELDNVCDIGDDPCYGAIVGKDIYITCWDNIIVGEVKGNKMSFISQIQMPDLSEDGLAATCKGTATKLPGFDPEIDDPCECP